MDVREAVSTNLKDWVKTHPNLANFVDRVLVGRRREIAPFTDIATLMGAGEREHLFVLARSNDSQHVIVELGCWAGGSSYFLGKGAEVSGSLVFSVDPFGLDLGRQGSESDGTVHYAQHHKPSKSQVEHNLERHGLMERVTTIEGFSLDVAARWDRSVGLLLIDGNHDHVREDFEAWKVHLARGAVVVFHDSNFPERKHASPYVSEIVEALIGEYQLEVLARIDRLTTVRWEGDH